MGKYLILLLLTLIMVVGCEDVVEVDVPKDETRLAIDALIRLDTDEFTTQVQVKATETTSFFEEIGPASLDQIQFLNLSTNTLTDLVEEPPGTGRYVANWSTDQLMQGELQLTIRYNNELYIANTTYVPTVPFDALKQGDGSLFSDDETEILVSYTDEENRVDFYLFDFDFNEYLVSEDTFYEGQSFEFSYFYEEGLESGRELNISIIGVNEAFYHYMNQLIVQSGGDQGPFQTPAATVRGNIINTDNIDNLALGYFAVCQEYVETIVLE